MYFFICCSTPLSYTKLVELYAEAGPSSSHPSYDAHDFGNTTNRAAVDVDVDNDNDNNNNNNNDNDNDSDSDNDNNCFQRTGEQRTSKIRFLKDSHRYYRNCVSA